MTTHRKRSSGKLSVRHRLVRRLLLASAVFFLGLPMVLLLSLRWLPPPSSALMIERRLSGHSPQITYEWVDLDQISPQAVVAVVAGEDQKFALHHGFDKEAIESALEEHEDGGRLRGASTISQQLAKNLFLWPGRNYLRKGLEAVWTVGIELVWPKRRIIEVYLNVVEFGEGTFGVGAASHRYFGKPAAQLTASEAALLAAVLPNPHRMRVSAPSPYLRQRQSWIQEQMVQLGGPAYLDSLD
ncbi:MAG: monofunctional biosynthetic peptidoglycan transglycosylase [Candidatus Eisenbacteria bacterium]|nr:monofunctional biosynthetic peptidoglycan transglycosylase [Candidatus Eisenbacteria bacterium]